MNSNDEDEPFVGRNFVRDAISFFVSLVQKPPPTVEHQNESYLSLDQEQNELFLRLTQESSKLTQRIRSQINLEGTIFSSGRPNVRPEVNITHDSRIPLEVNGTSEPYAFYSSLSDLIETQTYESRALAIEGIRSANLGREQTNVLRNLLSITLGHEELITNLKYTKIDSKEDFKNKLKEGDICNICLSPKSFHDKDTEEEKKDIDLFLVDTSICCSGKFVICENCIKGKPIQCIWRCKDERGKDKIPDKYME